jgi:hypothetical protein
VYACTGQNIPFEIFVLIKKSKLSLEKNYSGKCVFPQNLIKKSE